MKSESLLTSSGRRGKRVYTVQAVVRAAAIISAFSTTSEVLELRTIATRADLNKGTAFRILETLVETGLLVRVGKQGYRSRLRQTRLKRFRIGYASQSNLLPFTGTVTDSLLSAASGAEIDLITLNNHFSPRVALENADLFVAEKVDLVIDSQINYNVAAQISAKFSDAGIPFIAVDIPHPGGFYFGADNYKAGRMGGLRLAQWAMKQWKGTAGQIIYLGIDAAGPTLNSRLTGMSDGLSELMPGSKALPTCYYDTKGGQFEATLDTLRKHLRLRKKKRALVAAVNDTTALAAMQAFREAGLEEECAIVGQDASFEARQELRRPSTRLVGSVAYYPETYGDRLIRLALNILDKKRVPPAVFTTHELVTSENVDSIYPNDGWMHSGNPKVLPGNSAKTLSNVNSRMNRFA
jgi:ribose transport system substrate-binding protein